MIFLSLRAALFEKKYTYKSPSRHVLKLVMTSALILKKRTIKKACHRMSFRRLGYSAFRADILTEHCALWRSHICADRSPQRGVNLYKFQCTAKEYRKSFHLYSCIISYKITVVNRNANICLYFIFSIVKTPVQKRCQRKFFRRRKKLRGYICPLCRYSGFFRRRIWHELSLYR